MGIKFYCPQGHKLHVKSFLAGKKGVCPHCGTKVRIPLESQRDGAHDDGSPEPEESDISSDSPLDRPAAVPVGRPAPLVPAAAPVPATSPVLAAATGVAPAPAVSGMYPPAGVSATPAMGPAPGPRVLASAAPVTTAVPMVPRAPLGAAGAPAPSTDPFAEAPNAEWYVCPPTGGRFGPATGEILKRWIGEGRVTPDSLVWRSGWTDWKPASVVLPTWSTPGAASGPGIGPPPTPAITGQLAAAAPVVSAGATSNAAKGAYVARRKSSSTMGIVVVILLGILSVALLVALIWVINRTKG